MLSNYPILFDDTEIPFPAKWQEAFETIEDVNETEAGTDILNIRRIGKLTVNAEHGALSDLVKILRQFSQLPTFVLSIYDMIEEDYKTYTVRMRDYHEELVEKSAGVAVSQGVWKVSYTLYEL